MKDERLYARFAIEMNRRQESDFPYFCDTYAEPMVYLVSWAIPNGRIVKAGWTKTPSRWRVFVSRGAEIDGLWQGQPAHRLETALHDELGTIGAHAFATKSEALPMLGSNGAGYTECYWVQESDYTHLLSEVAA